MVRISSLQNNVLHVDLGGEPVMILITLFCCRNTFLLSTETPQNSIPNSSVKYRYSNVEI